MAVSLMNLLGAAGNVAFAQGDATDAATQGGEVAARFEGALDSAVVKYGKENVLRQLRQIVSAQEGGGDLYALQASGELPKEITQALQLLIGRELPSELALVAQDVQAVADAGDAFRSLIGQLPERELTADELSEIVAATGIPALAVLAALQETPAASPDLLAQVNAGAVVVTPPPVPDVDAEGAVSGDAVPVSSEGEVAAPDVRRPAEAVQAHSTEQLKVLEKIVNALQGEITGEAEAPEEWAARLAALAERQRGVRPEALKPLAQASVTQPAQETHVDNPVPQAKVVVKEQPLIIPVSGQDAKAQVEAIAQAEVAEEDGEGVAFANPLGRNPEAKGRGNAQANPVPVKAQQVQNAAPQAQQMTAEDGAEVAALPRILTAVSSVDAGQESNASTVSNAAASPFAAVGSDQNAAQVRAGALAESTPSAARSALPEEPVSEQISVHLKRAVATGESSIQVRLKPLELGTVDVRIETAADGQSRIHVTAEKRDTLELLQRDARALERALQDIGFKNDNGSLSFNLRGGEQQGQHTADHSGRGQEQGKFSLDGGYAQSEAEEENNNQPLAYDVSKAYRLTLDRGVDISV